MGAMRGHRWGQWGCSVTLSDLGAGALLLHPVCCKPHCCTPPPSAGPLPHLQTSSPSCTLVPFHKLFISFFQPHPCLQSPPLCKLHPLLAIPDPFCIPLYPLLAPLPLLQPPPFTAPPFPQPVPLCPLYPTSKPPFAALPLCTRPSCIPPLLAIPDPFCKPPPLFAPPHFRAPLPSPPTCTAAPSCKDSRLWLCPATFAPHCANRPLLPCSPPAAPTAALEPCVALGIICTPASSSARL